MDHKPYEALLHADISAVLQINRSTDLARTLIARSDWHPRLLHGSDYPLPGVVPLVWLSHLEGAGLLDASAVEPLARLREHNTLLFDFVLKRALRHEGKRWPASVFESGRLWKVAA
jgi:mannonate dehydratase